MKYNERKKQVFDVMEVLGGVTDRMLSIKLGIDVKYADRLLRHYWNKGVKGYVYRRKTNKGYKYHLNQKGRRVHELLKQIPEGAPLKLYRPYQDT